MDVDLSNRDDLKDHDLVFLEQLTTVDWLSLYGCTHVTSQGMQHLRNLAELRYLSLACTSVDGPSLAVLLSFPSLEILNLQKVRNILDGVRFISGQNL